MQSIARRRSAVRFLRQAIVLVSAVFLSVTYGFERAYAFAPDAQTALVPLVDTDEARLRGSVDHITTFATELEPRLWKGRELDPAIKQRAETIALSIIDQLGLSDLVVEDIVTLGSVSSYEYDKDADFDVHIFVNIDKYADKADLVKKYIAQSNAVNRAKYKGVSFYGYPAEFLIYAAHPSSQIEPGVSMYSIKSGVWLSEPVQSVNNFDKQQIFADALKLMNRYNELVSAFSAHPIGFDCSQITTFASEMRQYRREGITRDGIRSTPNLTYRMLRRLNINLPDSLREAAGQCSNINASLP